MGAGPVSLVGPHKNPVIVVPFFTAGAGLSQGDDAGERAAMGAGGSGDEEHMSCGDPWRKYALEAIIKLLFIPLFHYKYLLFMLELY